MKVQMLIVRPSTHIETKKPTRLQIIAQMDGRKVISVPHGEITAHGAIGKTLQSVVVTLDK